MKMISKKILSSCMLSLVLLLTACSKAGGDTATPVIIQPTITTTAPTSITRSGATYGGNVTSLGNQNIQVRGVAIATNSNPTLSDISELASGSGLGPYTTNTTRTLAPNTVYHVRAFIQTDAGVVFGNDLSFTTLP